MDGTLPRSFNEASQLPGFALSYPVQAAVGGIVFAFITSLMFHILFTSAYHYPLNRVNFLLQVVSTLFMWIFLSATLAMTLQDLYNFAQSWPYMFPYLAFSIPHRRDWNAVQIAFWDILSAFASLSAHVRLNVYLYQITHIQFLTLLFPSRLEKLLIFWILGPLALIQAGMEFSDFSPPDDYKTHDLADAIVNICDSSLALLYMLSILIWGCLVNWRRAWRLDGSTAAFGAFTIAVALFKTVVSFVHIGYDRLYWMRDFSAAFTNWQSWLGFWWWVSSGMGIGEYEDQVRRIERKKARKARRQRKLRAKQRKVAGGGVSFGPLLASRSNVVTSTSAVKPAHTIPVTSPSAIAAAAAAATTAPPPVVIAVPPPNQGPQPSIPIPPHLRARSYSTTSSGSPAPPIIPSASDPYLDGTHIGSDPTTESLAGTQTSGSDSLPWPISLLRRTATHFPAFVQRRLDMLQTAHRDAISDAAIEQATVYERVMQRWPSSLVRPDIIKRARLQDKTVYE